MNRETSITGVQPIKPDPHAVAANRRRHHLIEKSTDPGISQCDPKRQISAERARHYRPACRGKEDLAAELQHSQPQEEQVGTVRGRSRIFEIYAREEIN